MAKYRYRIVDVEAWKAEVVLIVGSRDGIRHWCGKHMPADRWEEIREAATAPKHRTSQGEMFALKGGGVLLWLGRMDRSVLVHELVHAAWHMLGSKGVPLCDETQEAYAYLMAHLYDRLSTT